MAAMAAMGTPGSPGGRAGGSSGAGPTGGLKGRLRTDLTTAMKARDELRTSTVRLVLAAISTEEVTGAQAHELSDDQVTAVLARQARQRRESAEAYDAAGRPELASRERAELAVIEGYLPRQLTDDQLAAMVDEVIGELGPALPAGSAAMGPVMRAVTARASGAAPGARVAAAVRSRLGLG